MTHELLGRGRRSRRSRPSRLNPSRPGDHGSLRRSWPWRTPHPATWALMASLGKPGRST